MHLSCQKQAEKYLKHTILAILFKKPTYLKNPWVFSFKKPILPAGFLNGFFKWVFYLIQPWPCALVMVEVPDWRLASCS